jgi:serine-type D-Ala-D-Ala carboxypeptidase (penicillin-binding protein 5/6)
MLKKIISALAAVLITATPCEAYSARSYALVEMTTGRLITGCNINQRLPMASTTKIMTGLLACESGKFDQVFTVPDEAVSVEGSSMGLRAGEKITLRNLTYGLLLESGNDAANTIATCLGGTVPEFVNRMNKRAEELHLTNTHFVTPSGLDHPEHYTTAIDLARLGAMAMKNSEFAKIAATAKVQIPYDGNENGRTLYNHNELLETYDGAIGIKTGFTKKSGRCLVSCAQRGGVTLVAVTLHSSDDWNDHKKLLDYGFGVLKSCSLFTDCPQITAKVTGEKRLKSAALIKPISQRR